MTDSIGKDFPTWKNIEVVALRGATVPKATLYLRKNSHVLKNKEIILLHLGTNHFSTKEEWLLFLKQQRQQISAHEYNLELSRLNPPPAIGLAADFRDQYVDLIKFVKSQSNAKILISSILPRQWDHDRRDPVRRSYNRILEKFSSLENVFYIASYKPFFQGSVLKENLFQADGLHLNEIGTKVLSSFMCDRIARSKRGELKQ